MRAEFMLATMLVCAVRLLPAQSTAIPVELQELQPGARIRFAAPSVLVERRAAMVLGRAQDTVTVGGDFPATRVPIAALTSLEVSRGRSRARGAVRGLRWGVPFGTLLGLALASTASGCSNCESTGAAAVSAFGWGALGGVVYGAGVGALFPVERWNRYDLPARAGR